MLPDAGRAAEGAEVEAAVAVGAGAAGDMGAAMGSVGDAGVARGLLGGAEAAHEKADSGGGPAVIVSGCACSASAVSWWWWWWRWWCGGGLDPAANAHPLGPGGRVGNGASVGPLLALCRARDVPNNDLIYFGAMVKALLRT